MDDREQMAAAMAAFLPIAVGQQLGDRVRAAMRPNVEAINDALRPNMTRLAEQLRPAFQALTATPAIQEIQRAQARQARHTERALAAARQLAAEPDREPEPKVVYLRAHGSSTSTATASLRVTEPVAVATADREWAGLPAWIFQTDFGRRMTFLVLWFVGVLVADAVRDYSNTTTAAATAVGATIAFTGTATFKKKSDD